MKDAGTQCLAGSKSLCSHLKGAGREPENDEPEIL